MIENFARNIKLQHSERDNSGQVFVDESLVVRLEGLDVRDLGALGVEIIFTATQQSIKIHQTNWWCICNDKVIHLGPGTL